MARVELNGKWGFIDKSGKFVIEPKFDEVGAFGKD
nr:WG repeat-containing protein [Campylobacter coli]